MADKLRSLDHAEAFDIVPSQQAGVRERFPWIRDQAWDESLQLVRDADDATWEGAAAIEMIANELDASRSVSWIFRLPFARPIATRLYRWFAARRRMLGCGEHCSAGQATRFDSVE
jgi:predicted DCC family thiol-disulfide oxidoreductase YuxK